MFGIILASISSLFVEASSSIGKRLVGDHKETIYTMGFLNLLWGTIFLLLIITYKQKFLFSTASLPTFTIRAILEILQAHITLKAICKAERSTFSFIRILTIPLLLTTDIILGYPIGILQIVGLGIMVSTILYFYTNNGLNKKGAFLALFTAINAVATISLYKYNITNFNSVEAEQFIIQLILIIYFIIAGFLIAKQNPFKFLKRPLPFSQSIVQGIGGIFSSFAYGFAPASIIMAAERSSSIIWAVLSGNVYFHEKHLVTKLGILVLLIAGIILLAI